MYRTTRNMHLVCGEFDARTRNLKGNVDEVLSSNKIKYSHIKMVVCFCRFTENP